MVRAAELLPNKERIEHTSMPTNPKVRARTRVRVMSDLDKELLTSMCQRAAKIQYDISVLEAEKKPLMEEIDKLATTYSINKYKGPGFTMFESGGSRSWIDEGDLLESGVGMDVIEKCTRKKSWTYRVVKVVEEKKRVKGDKK